MSKPMDTPGSPGDPQRHTRHILELLRGPRVGGGIPRQEASGPSKSVPTSSLVSPSLPAKVAPNTSRNTAPLATRPQPTHFKLLAKHLQQKQRGHLARVMTQTRQLAELSKIFLAYLPPNFHAHAILAKMDSEGWVVQTDSSTWATRLRYSLPNIRQQLGKQLGIQLPPPKVRIVPHDLDLPTLPPPRRISVTNEMVDTLESAARDLSDPRLGAAMMRLADHARRRQAEAHILTENAKIQK